MKKYFFTLATLIITTCLSNHLVAQSPDANKTAGYDLKKGVKCIVTATESGCDITFDQDTESPRDVTNGLATGKRGYDYYQSKSAFSISAKDNSVSPRDAASGLPTGKRMHKPIVITKELDKASPQMTDDVVSPRDAASGLPTGKRMHKPITYTKELDKSSPKLANETNGIDSEVAHTGGGAGKVSMQDMHFVFRCGGKTTNLTAKDGVYELPTDCPNGKADLIASWSWGATQTSSLKRCSTSFTFDFENGVCMAINEKGLPGEKGTIKK